MILKTHRAARVERAQASPFWVDEEEHMKIAEVMSRAVASCTVDDTLSAAAQLMWDKAVGSVVVLVDGGRLTGMVTDRDIAMAAQTQGRSLKEIPVRVAMAQEVETCRPHDTVTSVL